MHARFTLIVFFLAASALAQSAPSPCPAERPIDDIIAEIHKQQSKKYSRNKNPLPDSVCIFGWCPIVRSPKPPKPTDSAPPAETPASGNTSASTSRSDTDKCNEATERAIDAAHNVEVGDYYFEEKNFRAAVMRYQDADSAKPDDAAIHVRLGRAFEKLNDVPHAIENYKAAQALPGPEKWSKEAAAALERLVH